MFSDDDFDLIASCIYDCLRPVESELVKLNRLKEFSPRSQYLQLRISALVKRRDCLSELFARVVNHVDA